MDTITESDLDDFILQTEELGGANAEECKKYWESLVYEPTVLINKDLDPYSEEYFEQQLSLYSEISKRELNQHAGEQTEFDFLKCLTGQNPYGSNDVNFISTHMRAVSEAIMLAGLKPGSKVLDMGSGWGLSSELLQFMGCMVTSVDINPQFVRLTEMRSHFRAMKIQSINSSFQDFNPTNNGQYETDQKYDAILFYESLHHDVRPWDLLIKCSEWLQSDGVLILAGEPINNFWWPTWGLRLDPLSVYCIRKFGWFESGWSEEFLENMLVRANFKASVHHGKGMEGSGVVIATK